jgi:hypothetical protein
MFDDDFQVLDDDFWVLDDSFRELDDDFWVLGDSFRESSMLHISQQANNEETRTS